MKCGWSPAPGQDGLKGKNGSSIASCIRDVNNYHHF
jgi:hypothetical protein